MPYVRSGRPTPRTAETPSGMLNSIGLQGSGIDQFVEQELPWLAEHGARVLVSVAGEHPEEFAAAAARLTGQPGVVGIEANISCPNVATRGLVFACDAEASFEVVEAVRAAADPALPVYAKLTPDVTRITDIAAACTEAGADGLSMINTVLGMAIDTGTMRPALAGSPGASPGPRSGPSPCAACSRSTGRCWPAAYGGYPSSAWAGSPPDGTRSNSSSPAPPEWRSGRRCSTIRHRRCGSATTFVRHSPYAESERSRTPSGGLIALPDENRTSFTGQNRGILSVMYGSVEADQDFSSVLADWSGHGR